MKFIEDPRNYKRSWRTMGRRDGNI